jgi:tetratricopeptide (TPR) repeat protein
LEAERLAWYRSILLDRKQFEDALRIAKKELALVELGFGKQHRFAARALDGLSGALSGLCDYRAALDAQNRAASLVEAEYGVPHPQVASALGNQASLLASLGDHPEALRLKQRALAMFEQLPGHPNHVAMAQRNLVRTFLELERLDDAAAALEKATHLARSESDETNLLLLRGELHRHQGRWAEALADHGELRLRMKDKEIPRRIEPWVEFSKTNLAAGAVAEAEHAAREALPWAVSVYGEDSCRSAEVQRVLAEALVEGHRWEEARPFAEKALETRQRTEGDPVVRARAEFTLARVLEIADRPRAQTLATDARQRCEGRASGAGLQKKIDAWLGERGSNGRP